MTYRDGTVEIVTAVRAALMAERVLEEVRVEVVARASAPDMGLADTRAVALASMNNEGTHDLERALSGVANDAIFADRRASAEPTLTSAAAYREEWDRIVGDQDPSS